MATSAGALWVDIRYNAAGLGQDLRRSLGAAGASAGDAVSQNLSQRLQTLGTSLGNVGRQVSLGLSLPLVAFGNAASDAFRKFDTAMTQIVTLSGVEARTVRGWTDDVMALGETYGVAADEAAEGLYFITSSGVEASEAIGVLDVAARSSALGLGTTEVAADVVTSAMNQYGSANMSAAEAADILTVAVREGKGEADAMAGALARVIPLAGSMGVQFDEVAGVMSAMTLSGTSADEAATQINALLSTMQKMPKHAQADMKALTGLDYATVQSQLSTQGLTETLRTIYNAFGDNEEAIGKVFGNIRALRGITNLFGEKEEQTLGVIRETTNAMGAQEKAVKDLANSPAFQMRQAEADFRNAMTNIGGSVTPVLATVTEGLTKVLELSDFAGPAGRNILVIGAAAAAASGPLLFMGASVIRLTGNLISWSRALANTSIAQSAALRIMYLNDALNAAAVSGNRAAGALTRFGPALAKAGIAAAAAAATFMLVNAKLHENDEMISAWGEKQKQKVDNRGYAQLQQHLGTINEQIEQINREKDELSNWGRGVSPLPVGWMFKGRELHDLDQIQRGLISTGEKEARLIGQSQALAKEFRITETAAVKWIQTTAGSEGVYDDAADASRAYAISIKEGGEATKTATIDTEKAKNSLAGIIATVKDTSDAFFGVINAQKSYQQAQKAIGDAREKVTEAEEAHRDAIKDTAQAQRQVAEADRRVVESSQRVTDARERAAEAQRRLNDLLAGPTPGMALDVRSARLAVREAEEAARRPDMTANERERAQISLERARLDLIESEKAHEEAIADARGEVKDATDAVREAETARQDALSQAADARTALQEARDKEKASLDAIGAAQAAVTQAEFDAIPAAMGLTAAQQDLLTKFTTGAVEADKFRGYLTNLKDLYPELADGLQAYVDEFERLSQLPEAQKAPAPPPPAEKIVGRAPTEQQRTDWRERLKNRAFGGPVSPMEMYEVNERNVPELLVSGQRQFLLPVDRGHVVPLRPAEGGGGPSLNVGAINVYGADEPVGTAYEIRRQLRTKRDLVGRR